MPRHQTSNWTRRYNLKLFTQMELINRVDLMASTSSCAKLSQKNLSRLIWSYVKLNIQRKITHLFQKNPRKFDLIKREIARYDEQAELQKMKVIWWKLPPHDQYNTEGHAILDSHAICWKYRSPSEGGEGRFAPHRGPTPYPFTYHFTKKVPILVHLLLTKGTPFTYLV